MTYISKSSSTINRQWTNTVNLRTVRPTQCLILSDWLHKLQNVSQVTSSLPARNKILVLGMDLLYDFYVINVQYSVFIFWKEIQCGRNAHFH